MKRRASEKPCIGNGLGYSAKEAKALESALWGGSTREPVYFRKQGRRYVPVLDWNQPFEPADGVWLVVTDSTGRSMSRAFRLGDVPDVMTGAAFARHRDLIATTLNNTYDKHKKGVSARDLAEAIVLAVAAAESKGGKP